MKDTPHNHLSPRELEIIELIAHGEGREEIARKLMISKLTYDGHRKSIRQKLNIRNQADWVRVLHHFSES